MTGRTVTLVLCTGERVLGSLPPFPVTTPYWQAVEEVVAACRAVHGIDVVILRLLRAEAPTAIDGGPVSYLAQVARPPPADRLPPADRPPPAAALRPWTGPDPLAAHPLRMRYAGPGGPQADLAWAYSVLDARGIRRTGEPVQIRSWNLSSVWRVPTGPGPAWLKVVPPFFAHEGAMLRRLDPAAVPPVLGADDGRLLMADVPGTDQYDATGAPLLEMVRILVDLQVEWAGRLPELAEIGLDDRRPDVLGPLSAAVLDRHAAGLEPRTVDRVRHLLDTLPERFDRIRACGVPDSLVHGDFYPGNVRGRPGRFAVLDWGDCVIGHPMLDRLRFCDWVAEADRAAVGSEWSRRWREAVPGCAPDRAAALLRPVAPLFGAVMYQRFLDLIEPDERPYHAADPVACLVDAGRHCGDPDGDTFDDG